MKRAHVILIHSILWFIYIILPIIGILFNEPNFKSGYFHHRLYSSALNVLTFYITYFFIIPFIMRNKGAIKLTAYVLGTILFFLAARVVLLYRFYDLIDFTPRFAKNVNKFAFHEFFDVFTFVMLAALVKLAIDWYNKQRQNDRLINQNQSSELALLRSQLNPHFLFNTLNNIYSLSIKKSEHVSEAIMRLSDIMRYTLYETNTDKVDLNEEIKYLQAFIELQELRIKDKDFIRFNISGNADGKCIAPMLLIPFVENAFKHGNKKVELPGISVNIEIHENKLVYKVENYFTADSNKPKDKVGGIGLKNIKRRLQILYPKSHNLHISEENNLYSVVLEIWF